MRAAPPKALLLDLDGTLAETDSLHMPAWIHILRSNGIEADEEFYKERISGRLNPDIVADLLPALSPEEGRAVVAGKEANFREQLAGLEPLPGVRDFLDAGRRRGLATALVTNAPNENAKTVLRVLKLENAFDVTVTAEDVGVGKPHPKPYLVALRELGVPPGEALAFEDSSSGIAAAVAAGIPTVGIASTQDPQKLLGAGAFVVYEDFSAPALAGLLDGRAR